MSWEEGAIDGVTIRPLVRRADSRGWLAEIYREDEAAPELRPAMAYVSVTHPGVTRGPHEHREQTDTFVLAGPGRFMLRAWDERPDSATRGRRMTVTAGEDHPVAVIVPPGVVHAYRNVGAQDAWVFNLPNRLYAGRGRGEPVDEIRHEGRTDGRYGMD